MKKAAIEVLFEKYKFRPYNSKYKKQFLSEKRKLRELFPSLQIEHIGSTAVKDLGGKGIIDIQIGISKKEIKKSLSKMKNQGYLYIEKGGDGKERWFFRKDYKYRGEIRRVHVHLTIINSESWNKCILFRDYLRKNKSSLKEYASLKKQAVKLGKEGEEYRKYKKNFIDSACRKAKKPTF